MKTRVNQSHQSYATARFVNQINGIMRSGGRKFKRTHPRTPCFLLVDYASRGGAYSDFIKNISAGGTFIESRRPVRIGQELTLIFSCFDEQSPVKIAGEIAWIGQQGIGVKFKPQQGNRCSIDRIIDFVSSLMRASEGDGRPQ